MLVRVTLFRTVARTKCWRGWWLVAGGPLAGAVKSIQPLGGVVGQVGS